jgi:hypothetical protein
LIFSVDSVSFYAHVSRVDVFETFWYFRVIY